MNFEYLVQNKIKLGICLIHLVSFQQTEVCTAQKMVLKYSNSFISTGQQLSEKCSLKSYFNRKYSHILHFISNFIQCNICKNLLMNTDQIIEVLLWNSIHNHISCWGHLKITPKGFRVERPLLYSQLNMYMTQSIKE